MKFGKFLITVTVIALVAITGAQNFKNDDVLKTIGHASFVDDFTKLDRLMKYTDVVVKGSVKETKGSYTTNDKITWSDYTVTVDQVIYGNVPDSEIIVKQLGGEKEVADNNGKKQKLLLEQENHPLFKSGETYILFLNHDKKEDKWEVGALGYGAYKINNKMAENKYPGLSKSEDLLVKEIKDIKK